MNEPPLPTSEPRPTGPTGGATGSSPYPASEEHAPLSGLDEFLVHNSPYPVRVMWTPDAQAYERVWFTCQDSVGELLVVIGLAFYPNLGTAEAFAIVNVRGRHTTVRAHQRLPDRPSGNEARTLQLRGGRALPSVAPPPRPRQRSKQRVGYDITWLDTKRPVFRQLGAGVIVGGTGPQPRCGLRRFRPPGRLGRGRRRALRARDRPPTSAHATTTGASATAWAGRLATAGMQHPHSGEWVEFEDFGVWGDHVLYNIGDRRRRSATLARRTHRMRFEPEHAPAAERRGRPRLRRRLRQDDGLRAPREPDRVPALRHVRRPQRRNTRR